MVARQNAANLVGCRSVAERAAMTVLLELALSVVVARTCFAISRTAVGVSGVFLAVKFSCR